MSQQYVSDLLKPPSITSLMGENFDSDVPDPFSNPASYKDLTYLRNCTAKESAHSFYALYRASSILIAPKYEGNQVFGVNFTFKIDGRIKRIVFDQNPAYRYVKSDRDYDDYPPLVRTSPLVVSGVILYLGEVNIPGDLLLDDIFFLFFLPSKENLSSQQLYSQSKQSLESIKSRCPRLKHVFLKDISIDDKKEMASLVPQLGLEVHFL
jgi:hypothetical protein